MNERSLGVKGELLSVVVPCYNEARILPGALSGMWSGLKALDVPFEMVICENGSSDSTFLRAKEFQSSHPEVQVEQVSKPDYGLAVRRTIEVSQGEILIILNADFWSVDFVRQALEELRHCDLVVTSKVMRGAKDRRPFFRRAITRAFNGFLRVFYGFRGTDTQGLKLFKRLSLQPVLSRCVTNHFIFDTELVLRAQRRGLRIVEIPVEVRELRPPSYRSLAGRVPGVLWNLAKLWVALRMSSKG